MKPLHLLHYQKKKVIVEEVKEEIKEPSTLPPSIVKKEKTLSPPTIKTSPIKKTNQTETQEKDNEIGPPPIKKNKKPLGIKIIFWLGIIGGIPTFIAMSNPDFIFNLTDLFGKTFAAWSYIGTLFNIIAITLTFYMFRLGPIIFVSCLIVDIIFSFSVGLPFDSVIFTIITKIIFLVVMIVFYKKMKKFRFLNKLVIEERN